MFSNVASLTDGRRGFAAAGPFSGERRFLKTKKHPSKKNAGVQKRQFLKEL